MTKDNTMTPSKHTYEAFLMDYAAGTLCPALSTVMAAHVSLNPDAYRQMKLCEKIGGALLESECAPEPLSAGCLDKLMAKLDCKNRVCDSKNPSAPITVAGVSLPRALADVVPCCPPDWTRLHQGVDIARLKKRGPAQFSLMRIAPGATVPEHAHRGLEIMLVIEGAVSDHAGRYKRGDMIVVEENQPHSPRADDDCECVCLSVTTAPVRLTGWIGALINSFRR